ncbi:TPA: hypothetical protein HA371_05055 [Candidatus Woesearchaeota archaeon]|nr:hypothetical protein [Candidatus Woesearchaeota archaeon]
MNNVFVLMNMQEYLRANAFQGQLDAVLERQREIIEYCRTATIPIINVTTDFEGLDNRVLGEIDKKLVDVKDIARFTKKDWNAFNFGKFAREIRTRKYDNLFISGAYAGRDVLSTVSTRDIGGVKMISSKDLLINNGVDNFEVIEDGLRTALHGYHSNYREFMAGLAS